MWSPPDGPRPNRRAGHPAPGDQSRQIDARHRRSVGFSDRWQRQPLGLSATVPPTRRLVALAAPPTTRVMGHRSLSHGQSRSPIRYALDRRGRAAREGWAPRSCLGTGFARRLMRSDVVGRRALADPAGLPEVIRLYLDGCAVAPTGRHVRCVTEHREQHPVPGRRAGRPIGVTADQSVGSCFIRVAESAGRRPV
jgi:hypothetical protein